MEYNPPSAAAKYNAQRELQWLKSHLENCRERNEQEREKERLKEQEIRAERAKRLKEKAALLDAEWRKQPWKVGAQHLARNFESSVRKLPVTDLSPTALYRAQHCLPRNFQSPEHPFVTASSQKFSFGTPASERFLSKSAQALYKRREIEYKAEIDRRIRLELKRKVVAYENRWEPAQTSTGLFGMPKARGKYPSPKSHTYSIFT